MPAIPGLCHGLSTSAWPETFLAALISKNLAFVSDPRKSGFADALAHSTLIGFQAGRNTFRLYGYPSGQSEKVSGGIAGQLSH